MTTATITTVSATRAVANKWLITHLPDRFVAGVPTYDSALTGWQIPVWLSYPHLEPLRPVGELLVDAVQGNVKAHTSELYRQTKDIRLVQKALGHSSLSTTMIYTHNIVDEDMEVALKGFHLG